MSDKVLDKFFDCWDVSLQMDAMGTVWREKFKGNDDLLVAAYEKVDEIEAGYQPSGFSDKQQEDLDEFSDAREPEALVFEQGVAIGMLRQDYRARFEEQIATMTQCVEQLVELAK